MHAAGHEGRVFDLAFCPLYSGLLASASDDNSVRLWQIADDDQREISKQTGVCSGHKDSVLRVTWHSEGRLLASGVLCYLQSLTDKFTQAQ